MKAERVIDRLRRRFPGKWVYRHYMWHRSDGMTASWRGTIAHDGDLDGTNSQLWVYPKGGTPTLLYSDASLFVTIEGDITHAT